MTLSYKSWFGNDEQQETHLMTLIKSERKEGKSNSRI